MNRPVVPDQGYYAFLYGHTKYNREGGRKNKRTNMDLGQLQAQERGSLCNTFVQFSVHLYTIAGVYFVQNFYKATRNANSSLTVFSHCLLMPTFLSRQLPHAGCPPLPTVVNCLSLSFLGHSFPPPLLVSREISPSVLCVGFVPKQTKRSSDWRQHKRKRIATHRVTELLRPEIHRTLEIIDM